MANIIRIKRSTSSAAPTTLSNAELAFTEGTKTLYIGVGTSGANSASVDAIGGIGAFVSLGNEAQTITGVKTFTGATVLGTPASGTLSNCTGVSLTSGISGVLPVGNGGTGFTNLASAGIALRGANSDITSLAGLTTPLSLGQGGTGSASGVSLTTAVTGTLPVGNGGTSITTYNTGDLLYASAANTLSKLAKGTPGSSLVIRGLVPVWDTPTSAELIAQLTYTPANKAGDTMTGLLTLSGAPTADLHAATKAYVDATAQGIDVRASCRVATTENITLSTGTALTIDGVQTVAGDRVLVKEQTTSSQNGVYVVSAGAWSRATDSDSSAKVTTGMFTFVSEGTVNADAGFVLATNDVIVLGTTALSFVQFSGAGAVVAGAGLTKTGTTVDVVGTAGNIVVNADSIDLATVFSMFTVGTDGISFVQTANIDNYGRSTGGQTATVRTGSTSQTGILQLTDSTSSTSTTTAATPASVKSAYDLATNALPKSGGTMTGKVTTGAGGATYASVLLGVSAADPTSPVSGDLWNNTGAIKFYNGATKTIAFLDSNITGTASNVTSTVAVANGGTGATTTLTARGNLGVAIGSDVQAYHSTLAAVAGGTYTGASSITTLGTITTGTWTGTAIAVANGGTGAITNSGARTNLGLAIGSDVQAYSLTLANVVSNNYTLDGGTY